MSTPLFFFSFFFGKLFSALGVVTAARGTSGSSGRSSGSTAVEHSKGSTGDGETKSPFLRLHPLKKTRSSALGMSRHSSFKTSTGIFSILPPSSTLITRWAVFTYTDENFVYQFIFFCQVPPAWVSMDPPSGVWKLKLLSLLCPL